MFQRYGHLSFLMLLVGTFFGVFYSGVSLLLLSVQLSESFRLLLFQCATALVIIGAIIGVLGAISLFRSYRDLFEIARQMPKAQ
jgi:glucan phosphoethanolaminetransferase (alkaline phosphatase superfamily)